MAFGRRKKKEEAVEATEEAPATEEAADEPSQADTEPNGPYDAEEIGSHDGYVDLGSILVPPTEGLQLRLEVEERTKRVVALTLDLHGSSLQLQAFAAPRSEGLWDEIRGQIASSVGSQGGTVEEVKGRFGQEVVAKLPAETSDGKRGYRVARFIGFDGPRWFLRGVFGGDAALDREKAENLERLFRSAVVIRGENPLPPRDLLPLRLPKDAVTDAEGHVPADKPAEPTPEDRFKRGPEITHIG
ncbi:DUF3710 domain-containing protein [Arthrobacter castelli]|uniref:DUF3710 domain-containing protein n=1 Tax=Arthrobacter castelli TaxID=271431 RepID=UPI0004091F3F|nr:DUF3710 domain-containing protein [Arthrobacter castelli]